MIRNRRGLIAFLTAAVQPIQSYCRSVGPGNDVLVQRIAHDCDAPNSFDAIRCPGLINCMFTRLPYAVTTDFQSGANVAALLPTVLKLVMMKDSSVCMLRPVKREKGIVSCVGA